MSMVLDYILEVNGTDNIFWIFYVMNLILSAIAYQLGFAKKLPIGKNIIVYILLMIGTFVITIFSTVMRMPTIECLIVIILVLGIYRFRLHRERKNRNSVQEDNA
ncbi:YlaH-like family protein [Oceanobacillus jeddahense]|uniref:YlaH-like family protein n=2 Tax=Oceanobacillus jeddahense TaxID=1462527 RepID=A0ABY5JZZ0_9BACI|nr:YlaH-like family protein [Oceanobacillus jeddahense]UUI05596.1 YlaH-like family protein [Oceanobacillus jeddahense]